MSRRKKGPSTILSALEEQPKKCESKASASEPISAAVSTTTPVVDEKNATEVTLIEDVTAFPMPESKPAEIEQPAAEKEVVTAKDVAAVEEKPAAEETETELSRPHKKADPVVTVHIQSLLGGDIEVDTIISRVRDAAPGSKDLTIYVKAEDNKAYFTTGEESGAVDLW